MPLSNMSRVSMAGQPRSELAASYAEKVAKQEISARIRHGELNPKDHDSISREYKSIFSLEYYKYYANFLQQEQRIIYVPTENPAARKFINRHTVANFSKLNCLIHVHRESITVGRINYPLDEDSSLDTKEAFLGQWPGPLDRFDAQLGRKVTDYIETLKLHDPQRRIKYCISANDDQRRTILALLKDLLLQNGTIDASGITRLLLKPEQIALQKDDENRRPLETLQKFLLLGKRKEAIKFAKSKKLWDHAQCLAFLDKYQPPRNYSGDGSRLKDDSIVQLQDEYINGIDQLKLKIVYRSLLNKILQNDPESRNMIKDPTVDNQFEFALLSANDCKMDFDQSNEIFKLIEAVKQARQNPPIHLISLGFSSIDSNDPSDDISFRSHLSFKQGDTYASRTLTISNIDMLILNEIWEYCLNLGRGTCNPRNYDYLINLVPYKLIFASRLLDFGLHLMFDSYLNSIQNALAKARNQPYLEKDSFYDWDTIEKCVEHLSSIWEIFRMSPEFCNLASPQQSDPESLSQQMNNLELGYNPPPPANFNPIHHQPPPPPLLQNDPQSDHVDSSHNDYTSLPYQNETGYTMGSSFNPPFSPINEYDDLPRRESDLSRRTSIAANAISQNEMQPDNNENSHNDYPSMPYQSGSAFTIGDSFNPPYSPINQYDDLPRQEVELNRPSVSANSGTATSSSNSGDQLIAGGSNSGNTNNQHPGSSNTNNNGKPQSAGDQQQSSLFSNILGSAKALLPKSNSKQMILPDDSSKSIVYDDKKGAWIDTTKPDGPDGSVSNDAPPMMMNVTKPPSYSFVTKSSKSRYPKAQF